MSVRLELESAYAAAVPQIVPKSPESFASLINAWYGTSYNASTGNLPATSGSRMDTLAQASSSKRPAAGTLNGITSLVLDGVDDELATATLTPAMTPPPYTLSGVFTATNSTGVVRYAFGANFSPGYQFITYNGVTDAFQTDPSAAKVGSAADASHTHHWAFVVTASASNNCRAYRDGVLVGIGTMTAPSGNATQFFLGSAGGGGYLQMNVGELHSFSAALSADDVAGLAEYARQKYSITSAFAPRDVWLAIGESGTAGQGNPADLATVYPGYPQSSLYMMRGDLLWAPLSEPCADGSYPTVGVGPYGMFGGLASAARSNREVAIINAGVNGTRSDQWLPGDASNLYKNALDRILAASSRPNSTFRGFLCFHGINDAYYFASSPPWAANWTSIESSFRSELGSRATGKPFIYTRIFQNAPTDTTYPSWAEVVAQQIAWQTTDRIMVTPPEGPFREAYKLHLNTAGNYTLAQSNLTAWQSHSSYA